MSRVPIKIDVRPPISTVEKSHKRKKPDDTDWETKEEWDNIIEATSTSKISPNSLPELREWDQMSLPDGFFMVLEGKRRTGKSTFAKWLLQFYCDKFSLVWCMTNTKCSGYWDEFVGDAFTFQGWNPSAIWNIVERNDKIIKQYGEDSETAKQLGSVLIILDDVVSSKIHDDPMFKLLATEGRHHLISIILMIQDPKAINPAVRDNCDCAVIFNQKTFRNKESIWHDFMNDTVKDLGMALLTRYAVNHDCIVSDQTVLDADLNKCFFKSTCEKLKLKNPDYALGGPTQKEIIFKERKAREEMKRLQKQHAKGATENGNEIRKLTTKEILKR